MSVKYDKYICCNFRYLEYYKMSKLMASNLTETCVLCLKLIYIFAEESMK